MSTTSELQIAPLPTSSEVALTLLQWMFSTIGIVTDYNIGSVIRTYSEAIGATEEIEGITSQAQAVQALVYSAYAAFGISPLLATPSVGAAVFSTLSLTPLPAGQSVLIPLNSIIQTPSGIQFATTSNVVLTSGTSSVAAPIQSILSGSTTNVPANTITQLATGLAYPLSVTNPLPTTGGSDAETASQTLTRFLAYVDQLGLCTPIAVASAARTVSYQQESVQYSSVIEPWNTGILLGTIGTNAGFCVAIDNGSGTASVNLLNAVTNYLNNGLPAGYRPAGVPFDVIPVSGVACSTIVIGQSVNPALASAIQIGIGQAILSYFSSLNFGDTAQLTQLIAAIADVSFGQLTSLSVTLLDQFSNPQTTIIANGALAQRIILSGYSVTIN